MTAYAADGENAPLQQRCAALLDDLRRARALSVSLPADRLLERLYREMSIPAILSARSGGRQRLADLQKLDQFVRGYAPGEYRGLSAFVRYVDRMQERGGDLPAGEILRADAVQLGQQLGRTGAGRTVSPARRTQLQQVRICTAACQPHPQQVAVRPGGQCQRRGPQQDIPTLPRAVKPVQKADPAGQYPHPQAGAGQGKRLRAVQFSDFSSAAIYFRVEYQFQHLYINKMLFSNRL